MAVLLPKDVLYTFSVPTDSMVTVTVTDGGPVEWSDSLAGPFEGVDGTLTLGAPEDFTRPVTLRAKADATIDLVYPEAAPPEPPASDADTEPA